MTCKFRKLTVSWSKTSNRSIIESPRHASSLWNPVDLILDKLCIVVNGERLIIFLFQWNCAMNYTYDVCCSCSLSLDSILRSSSFVLNCSVNYIVSPNTRHQHQHGCQLGVERGLENEDHNSH